MKTSLHTIKVIAPAQDGPISHDMRQHLQAVSELLYRLPDADITPARRSIEALFECLERVQGLENAVIETAEMREARRADAEMRLNAWMRQMLKAPRSRHA